MSDIDLTPEEWRLARQAGAAFTADTNEQDAGEEGEQLAIANLGPQPGELLLNIHTQTICCVISAATRRKTWVKLRRNGRVTEIPLTDIGKHYRPCRPDGSLR